MTRFRDMPAAVIGRMGETLAQRLLRQLGAGVIASFKFSGENDNEAPAIEFHESRITTPDMDVSMRGRRFWLELKTYKEPQWNRAHRCMVHGVPTRLIDQYEQTEKATGTPVFLGVLEVSTGSLLVSDQSISALSPRYACLCGCENHEEECDYRRKWGTGYPQWYFRRDGFREWSRLEGETLSKLQREHGRVSHALRRHRDNESSAKPLFVAKPSWDWACLACNETWIESKQHRCFPRPELIAYWKRRLAYAQQDPEKVSAPIHRSLFVEWFGANWSPETDYR